MGSNPGVDEDFFRICAEVNKTKGQPLWVDSALCDYFFSFHQNSFHRFLMFFVWRKCLLETMHKGGICLASCLERVFPKIYYRLVCDSLEIPLPRGVRYELAVKGFPEYYGCSDSQCELFKSFIPFYMDALFAYP